MRLERWINTVPQRLRALFRRRQLDRELDEELQDHIERQIDEHVARGLTPEQARTVVLRAFGGLERRKEECRDMRRLNVVEDVWKEIGHAARVLRRSRSFTAIAVLTLALGIGANTAIFSVVYGVLLKPLPFDEADRLVAVYHLAPGFGASRRGPQSPATYFTYRDRGRVFEDIGLWMIDEVSVTGRGEPERVQVLRVTDGLLPLLRARPVLGRLFRKGEDTAGSPHRALLTYGYWQQAFGGARDVIGRSLAIDATPHEIMGVLPASFKFLRTNPQVLLPTRLDRAEARTGEGFMFRGVARLDPGVTLSQANDDIARMIPLLVEQFPLPPGVTQQMWDEVGLAPNVRPLSDEVIGDIGRRLWILLGTVAIVLLIACANVANLFLVRIEGRQQELAVRAALGASRGRIARALLAESLMMGLAGGVVGLALAQAAIGLLRRLAPADLPRVDEIGLDPVVLLFTLAISVVTGLLFGLLPVLRFGTPNAAALQEGGRSASDAPGRHRTRNALVVAEVALAIVLLVVSGLMIRTFVAMRQVDPGFVYPENVQTFRLALPENLISDPEQVARTHEQIARRLEQVPGVTAVGLSSSITMDGEGGGAPVFVEDQSVPGQQLPPLRTIRSIAPGYFETMGNRVVAGRGIMWTDVYGSNRVVLISENLAREYWKEPSDAVGKRVRGTLEDPWRQIVGVVGNIHYHGLNRPAPTTVYFPMYERRSRNFPGITPRVMTYAVRSTRVGASSFLRELQQAVSSINPSLPLADVQTLEEIQAESMAQTSFAMVMLAIAASVALLLGVVGIYGVITYVAAQRTREIGIRMALGAQPGDVRRLFLRHGLVLTLTGVALGIGAAMLLMPVMSALLFGVGPMDPVTYVAVAAGLTSVALVATYLPARRASRIDPIIAVRSGM